MAKRHLVFSKKGKIGNNKKRNKCSLKHYFNYEIE
jgi:hypothetical protein